MATLQVNPLANNSCTLLQGALPLAIFQPPPEQAFFSTCRAAVRRSIILEERIGPTQELLSRRYLGTTETSFGPLSHASQLVVFHEMFTEEGQCFACPQMLEGDLHPEGSFAAALHDVHRWGQSSWHWVRYDDDRAEYVSDSDGTDVGPAPNLAFEQQLDAALFADDISDPSHRVFRRLKTKFDLTEHDDIEPLYVEGQ